MSIRAELATTSDAGFLAWACSTELFSYEACIFYTVLAAVPTLDRVRLKAKVVDAPEILTVIEAIPHLSAYLNALYECRYAEFFRVRTPGCCCLVWHSHPGLEGGCIGGLPHRAVGSCCLF